MARADVKRKKRQRGDPPKLLSMLIIPNPCLAIILSRISAARLAMTAQACSSFRDLVPRSASLRAHWLGHTDWRHRTDTSVTRSLSVAENIASRPRSRVNLADSAGYCLQRARAYAWGGSQKGGSDDDDNDPLQKDNITSLGLGTTFGADVPIPTRCALPEHVRVASIHAFDLTCAVLSSCGEVYAWGQDYGSYCHVKQSYPDAGSGKPWLVPFKQHVVQLTCGEAHLLMVTDLQQLWSLGTGGQGQLGHGDLLDQPLPRRVNFGNGTPASEMQIRQAAAGDEHSLVVTHTGEVFAWGNVGMPLGVGDLTFPALSPKRALRSDAGEATSEICGVRSVYTSHTNSFCVTESGDLYRTGGWVSALPEAPWEDPEDAACFMRFRGPWEPVRAVSASLHLAMLCSQARTVYLVGCPHVVNSLQPLDPRPRVVTSLTNTSQVCTDGQICFAVLGDGSLKAWGQSHCGLLGTGNNDNDLPQTVEHVCCGPEAREYTPELTATLTEIHSNSAFVIQHKVASLSTSLKSAVLNDDIHGAVEAVEELERYQTITNKAVRVSGIGLQLNQLRKHEDHWLATAANRARRALIEHCLNSTQLESRRAYSISKLEQALDGCPGCFSLREDRCVLMHQLEAVISEAPGDYMQMLGCVRDRLQQKSTLWLELVRGEVSCKDVLELSIGVGDAAQGSVAAKPLQAVHVPNPFHCGVDSNESSESEQELALFDPEDLAVWQDMAADDPVAMMRAMEHAEEQAALADQPEDDDSDW